MMWYADLVTLAGLICGGLLLAIDGIFQVDLLSKHLGVFGRAVKGTIGVCAVWQFLRSIPPLPPLQVPSGNWIALIYGIALAWLFIGRSILENVRKRQIFTAAGLWLGACLVTIPPSFALVKLSGWVIRLA